VADTTVVFDDGQAYEHFMGRWSRALGALFLDWLAPPKGARWLEIGCGTGAFTQVLLDTSEPASVAAIDPAAAQIEYARTRLQDTRVDLLVADAQHIPFPDGVFDLVASGLVINFIPDCARALAEMRRVCRPDGCVAGYVWDFAGERSSGWPLRLGFRKIGFEPPPIPGLEDTGRGALHHLLARAGLHDIDTSAIEVTLRFASFDEYWRSQTPAFTPQGMIVAKLTDADRLRLRQAVRDALPTDPDGGISYAARANAVKAVIPRD
jgi:SAM-dependent methyltransferase